MSQRPRIVTLVVDDPRGTLPTIEIESPWWMESGPVVEAARSAFGVEVTVVRLLSGESFPGGPVTYLVEAPGVDAGLLRPWVGDLPDDPHRAPYARIGGVRSLVDWADEALDGRGLARSGPVEQIRTWNLSCLLRLPLVDGRPAWLKAVPAFFAHEPSVMQALAEIDSSLVPALLATAPGVTLMAEAGDHDGYEVGPDEHFDAVRRFHGARQQLDLGALTGVPRVGADEMVADLAGLHERHGHELDTDEQAQLAQLVGEGHDRWTAAGLDPTLVHGDLHGGNLRLTTDGAATIIDWGDATVSHPLLDLAVLDSYTPHWNQTATERWLDLLGCDRAGWDAFRPLAAIRLAVVYRTFCDEIEASEQIYHRGDIVPAIRTGLSFFR